MNADGEQFEALRRLLALKRHEQPPPGYFQAFSSCVIARIRAGDRPKETFLERFFGESLWLQRLWGMFEAKPLLAGSLGAAFCGMLMWGAISSDRPDASLNSGDPSNVVEAAIPAAQNHFAQTAPPGILFSNGVVNPEPRDSLFRELPRAIPVNFIAPGGN